MCILSRGTGWRNVDLLSVQLYRKYNNPLRKSLCGNGFGRRLIGNMSILAGNLNTPAHPRASHFTV